MKKTEVGTCEDGEVETEIRSESAFALQMHFCHSPQHYARDESVLFNCVEQQAHLIEGKEDLVDKCNEV